MYRTRMRRHLATTEAVLAAVLRDVWLNSPDHRPNLLDADWERQAIGVVVDAEGQVFASHHCCR